MVVFLMAHGADARAANHLGETPLDLGSRLTAGFPKSRSLFMSILDSSKYQVSGGTIFIVPGKPPPLTTLKEHDEDGGDHDASTPRNPTANTTIRGITFSPSRRNRRIQKRQELANSHLPYAHAHGCQVVAAHPSSSIRGVSIRNVPVLPRGDHETALGGARHRLAAGFACCNSRERKGHQRDLHRRDALSPPHRRRSAHASQPGSATEKKQAQGFGVNFTDFRMGRSSAVLVRGGRRRRGHTCPGPNPRPVSCRANVESGRSRRSAGGGSTTARPATTNRRMERNCCDGNADGGCRRTDNAIVGQQHRRGQGREETRLRKRGTGMVRKPEKRRGEGGPSLPDSEVRRQIAEWLRETAGITPTVPPTASHGSGEYLAETSSYVASSHRSDVHRALQAIKGDGRGELLSAEKLRMSLCRVGQPLSPEEMDDLLREADPEGTGCVVRRLSGEGPGLAWSVYTYSAFCLLVLRR